jgi:hypothetical protein
VPGLLDIFEKRVASSSALLGGMFRKEIEHYAYFECKEKVIIKDEEKGEGAPLFYSNYMPHFCLF